MFTHYTDDRNADGNGLGANANGVPAYNIFSQVVVADVCLHCARIRIICTRAVQRTVGTATNRLKVRKKKN